MLAGRFQNVVNGPWYWTYGLSLKSDDTLSICIACHLRRAIVPTYNVFLALNDQRRGRCSVADDISAQQLTSWITPGPYSKNADLSTIPILSVGSSFETHWTTPMQGYWVYLWQQDFNDCFPVCGQPIWCELHFLEKVPTTSLTH